MDFIEGLPLSDGCDTILVVVCCLTKMALFIPTFQDIDAEDLAHIFLSQVFAKHGTPTEIVSDQGKHFISHFWWLRFQLLGIKANLSMAYHPETNGQTKWVNQILEQYLWVYFNYQQDDWVNLLPWLSLHTTTLCTLQPWSPLSLLTRVFILNSKCPLNLLCQTLLARSYGITSVPLQPGLLCPQTI